MFRKNSTTKMSALFLTISCLFVASNTHTMMEKLIPKLDKIAHFCVNAIIGPKIRTTRKHVKNMNVALDNYNKEKRKSARIARDREWEKFCRYTAKNPFWVVALVLAENRQLSHEFENPDLLSNNAFRKALEKVLIRFSEEDVLNGFNKIFIDPECPMFFDSKGYSPDGCSSEYNLKKIFPEVFAKSKMMKKEYENFKEFSYL